MDLGLRDAAGQVQEVRASDGDSAGLVARGAAGRGPGRVPVPAAVLRRPVPLGPPRSVAPGVEHDVVLGKSDDDGWRCQLRRRARRAGEAAFWA